MRASTDTAKKLVSLRLQKKLIADLKVVAKARGTRYQTLVNRVLKQYVDERGIEP